MPKKPEDEKKTGRLLLSLDDTLESELREVASANETTVQDLLRRAARAIVECQRTHHAVPLDMELYQRVVGPGARPEPSFLLNEAQAQMQEKLRGKAVQAETRSGSRTSRAQRK